LTASVAAGFGFGGELCWTFQMEVQLEPQFPPDMPVPPLL
jgi:hypothetical protein